MEKESTRALEDSDGVTKLIKHDDCYLMRQNGYEHFLLQGNIDHVLLILVIIIQHFLSVDLFIHLYSL